MGDDNTCDASASSDFCSATEPPAQCSSSEDPPPSYTACVSHPATVTSCELDSGTEGSTLHSHPLRTGHTTKNPDSDHDLSEAYPLIGIHQHVTDNVLHGNTSGPQFLDVTTGPGNRNDGYGSTSDPYRPQPAYNPCYPADQPHNPRANVYGRKTIVLQRTDAESSARKKKIIVGLFLGFFIGTLIIMITITSIVAKNWNHRSKRNEEMINAMNERSYESDVYGRKNFHASDDESSDHIFNDKSEDDFKDTPWKPKESVTAYNPYRGNEYENPLMNKHQEDKTVGIPGLEFSLPNFLDEYNKMLGRIGKNHWNEDEMIIKPPKLDPELRKILRLPADDEANEKVTGRPPSWK